MSRNVPNIETNPKNLLNLNNFESDMFMDLFVFDFCKISEALQYKSSILQKSKNNRKHEYDHDEDAK